MKRATRLITACLGMVVLAGCHKKQTVVAVPPPPPPQVTPNPVPAPPSIVTAPQPKPSTPTEAAKNEPPRRQTPPQHRHPHPTSTRPSTTDKNAQGNSSVASAAPPEPVISTSGQDDSSRNGTQQLLDDTDRQLLGIRRTLSADEVNVVKQIRSYQRDAREALRVDDVTRAYNLALKGHRLALALAGRQ
jgi:hypothetical protein